MTKEESAERLNDLKKTIRGLQILADSLVMWREELTPKKVEWGGKTDARRMALANIYRPCVTNLLLLSNLLCGLHSDQDLDLFAKLVILDEPPEQRRLAFWDIEFSIRTNTVLILQFQVENLFQNLNRELGGNENKRFVDLAKQLFKKLNLKNEQEMLDQIRCLAFARNSLHNNGTHNGHDFSKTLRGILVNGDEKIGYEAELVFKCDARILIGPIHVMCLLCNVTEIVREVLSCAEIKSIPGPIMDKFAWGA